MARTPSAARETRALPKFHHHLPLHAQGILPILRSACAKQDGGRGGIRTHGGLPHARFRVECLKPDSATLPNRSILSILFYDAQLSDAALRLQKQSIARSGDSGKLLWSGSALHRGVSEASTNEVPRFPPPSRKFLKNVTILGLPRSFSLLHIVCPQGRLRYYLLLTGIHRLLAPLFTIIRTLFRTSTLPHRHDSTKTRDSASFT
jgi:hypothetical protein